MTLGNEEILAGIKNTEWFQDWTAEAGYSFFEASIDIDTYFSEFRNQFGKSLPQWMLLGKEGKYSCYLPAREYEELGTYLAHEVLDDSHRAEWISTFVAYSDEILSYMKIQAETLFDNFDAFEQAYQRYGAYQIATKMAFNFLPQGTDIIANEFEKVRKYSETFYHDSPVQVERVLELVASRVSYPVELLRYMLASEFKHYRTSGELPGKDTLTRRSESLGVHITEHSFTFLSCLDVENILRHWEKDISGGELKGMIAYAGKVTGRCRVVHDFLGVDLAEGEILITRMTDPYFVPLMKKAAAIVTDGGGMLCHAAIVAREMKKPCIIGTKFATRIFKDGDMVEVDAEKGIVRKI